MRRSEWIFNFIRLYFRASGRGSHSLGGCKESRVKNIKFDGDVNKHALAPGTTIIPDSNREYTPGEFFRDAGTLIAVCLGLGLAMQVLLG